MKPTTIGGVQQVAEATPVFVPEIVEAIQTTALVPVSTGSIVVSREQLPLVEKKVASLDFTSMPAGSIIQIGMEAEQGLNKTLDGFLARLDKKTASKVFALFDRLQKGVDDANLPDILKKIQEGDKPGALARLGAMFRGKNAQELAHDAYEEIRALLSGKTKNLADVMAGMEKELHMEMQKLFTELDALNRLKTAYRDEFAVFAVEAATAQTFLAKAKACIEAEADRVAKSPTIEGQTRLEELQSKLQLLESRALALEATYTRLPADHQVIQQIEGAGVATLQETATTAASRFASIKMTLLALNGALAVKGVQQLGERQAKLDRQLAEVRGQLTRDIVTTAVVAPGQNRLEQATQIEKIIADTNEIRRLIEDGRKTTADNFAEARKRFEAARQALSQPQA